MHFKFEIWICNLSIKLMNKFLKRGDCHLTRNANQPAFWSIPHLHHKHYYENSTLCFCVLYCTALLNIKKKKKGRQHFLKVNKNEIKNMIKDNFHSLLILP